MLNRLAATVSVLLSPFLVPVVSILVVVHIYTVAIQQALLWALTVILFVSVLPSLYIFILFCLGRVSDLHLANRDQRLRPLLFSLISVLVGTAILYFIDAPREIIWLCVAYATNCIVFTLITPLWKISFHSGVAAGCMTALTLLVSPKLAWLFLLLPLIAWARVHRKRHTVLQTVVAAVIAVTSTIVILQWSL